MVVRRMQDISALLNAAISHHQAGRLDAAIAGYRGVLLLDPSQSGAMANLGSALCEQGKPAEAETYLRRAVSLVKELERQLSINEDVLRYMTIRVEELDLELSPVLARRDRDREREPRREEMY